VLALVLGACAGAPPRPLYSPQGEADRWGHSENQIADDTWEVTWKGPRYATARYESGRREDIGSYGEMALDMARWRAAELALANDRPVFRVVDSHTESEITLRDYDYYPSSAFLSYPGYRGSGFGLHTGLGYGYYSWPAASRAWLSMRAVLTVALSDGGDDEAGDLDAAAVRAAMRARYPGEDGSATAGPAR